MDKHWLATEIFSTLTHHLVCEFRNKLRSILITMAIAFAARVHFLILRVLTVSMGEVRGSTTASGQLQKIQSTVGSSKTKPVKHQRLELKAGQWLCLTARRSAQNWVENE